MRRVRLLTACVAAASVVVAVPGTAADLRGRSAPAIGTTGASDPARWVNPFVGTDASAANYGTGGGAGNTYLGATTPFGMVQWSPDTAQQDVSYVGGYGWHDTHIRGFGLTHMSGAGCAIYGDIPFLPTAAPITASPAKPFSADLATQFQPAFSHQHEAASPGYYSVVLDPGTTRAITTELSATTRTGAARMTFPSTRSASVLINAGGSAMADSAAAVHIDSSHREVTGSASSGRFCYQQGGDYTVYFAAVFDRPFTAHGTWQRQTLHAGGTDDSDTSVFPENYGPVPGGPKHIDGDPSGTAQAGAYVSFDTRAQRVVNVRVGVSFVSVEDAQRNLAAEQPSFAFDHVRAEARTLWNAALGRVDVSGGTDALHTIFETALYHAMLQPRTFSDVNGNYPGMDGNVHVARGFTMYADFSGWDVYRTQIPLLSLLMPDRASDLVRSLLADYQQSGWLPKWSFANQNTEVMTGDPADPTIAAAYAMGARNFDTGLALQAMVHGATAVGVDAGDRYVERPGEAEYDLHGWIPSEEENHLGGAAAVADPAAVWGPAATTLEYTTADFAAGAFAREVCGPLVTTQTLLDRSARWRNLLHDGYIEPRSATGAFLPNYSPTSGDGFVEGDGAQYTWGVLHDPAGLVQALGGRAAASKRLDQFFTQLNAGPASSYAYLGNEPTLNTPYLYDWTGEPWKAQRVLRRAMLSLYSPVPGGLPGNDDLGTMSAWWVLGALGLYPAVPGTDVLALSTPLFPHTVLHLPGGSVRIDAPGAPGKGYVAGLSINGQPHQRAWLQARTLLRGANLSYTLLSRPIVRWGAHDPPPSGVAAIEPPSCSP